MSRAKFSEGLRGITVDPAMGGGNRLQIRDQQLRYTPGADFE